VALLERGSAARRVLLLPLGEAMTDIGEFAVAQTVLEEAIESATAAGDETVRAAADLLRGLVRGQSGGREDWGERIVAEAEAAIPVLESAGDHGAAAGAWRALAWAHGTAGRFGRTAEAADRAVAHAVAAGDDRQRRRASVQYAVSAVYGPTPVPAAIARCEGILAQATGDRRTEGIVSSLLARLVAMDGDIVRARTLYLAAQAALDDGGRSVVAASTSLDACGVEMLAGEPGSAERLLRRDFEALSAMGERYLRSTVAGELVRALAAQDKVEEAMSYSALAEEMAAEEDVASQALWRAGRARLLARTGEAASAVALADEAVRLIEDTDAVITRADALSDQAEVLLLVGDTTAAERAAAAALDLHERKGNRAAVAGTRQWAAALHAVPDRRPQRM
jgi:tetratricopeptide (TPR) repeat protein